MGNKRSKFNIGSCKQDTITDNLTASATPSSEVGRKKKINSSNAVVPVQVWHAFLTNEALPAVNNDIDILDARNRRDIDKVLAALKTCNFKRFCIVLKSDPFIQNWKIFEEAVDNDAVFCKINTKGELTEGHPSFTLRLMEQGYKITERELDLMEMRLKGYSKFMFRALKHYIIDHHLVGMMTLQNMCRRSLKRAYRERDYVKYVKSLSYPELLKDFLLKGS